MGANSYRAFCCWEKHVFRWIRLNIPFLGCWNVLWCLFGSGVCCVIHFLDGLMVWWKLCLALGGLGFLEFNMKSLSSSLQSLNKIPLLSLTVAVCKGGKQYISLQRETQSNFQRWICFCPFFTKQTHLIGSLDGVTWAQLMGNLLVGWHLLF